MSVLCKVKNDENQKYCSGCGTWLLSERFPAVKYPKPISTNRLFVCSFCDTANEPGRNTCKKCLKPLFSTEYETKEVTISRTSIGTKILKVFVGIISIIIVLFGILITIASPNDRLLPILLTLFVLSSVQLLFGLIHPLYVLGKMTSRKKVFQFYGITSIVLFIVLIAYAVFTANNISVTPTANSSDDKGESEENYKLSAQSIPYNDIARNPDNYKGERVTFEGEVIQVIEQGNTVGLRINVTKGEFDIWKDTIFVKYQRPEGEDRILENDIIDVWGVVKGLETYTTIFGENVSLPSIDAKYISIKKIERADYK